MFYRDAYDFSKNNIMHAYNGTIHDRLHVNAQKRRLADLVQNCWHNFSATLKTDHVANKEWNAQLWLSDDKEKLKYWLQGKISDYVTSWEQGNAMTLLTRVSFWNVWTASSGVWNLSAASGAVGSVILRRVLPSVSTPEEFIKTLTPCTQECLRTWAALRRRVASRTSSLDMRSLAPSVMWAQSFSGNSYLPCWMLSNRWLCGQEIPTITFR